MVGGVHVLAGKRTRADEDARKVQRDERGERRQRRQQRRDEEGQRTAAALSRKNDIVKVLWNFLTASSEQNSRTSFSEQYILHLGAGQGTKLLLLMFASK